MVSITASKVGLSQTLCYVWIPLVFDKLLHDLSYVMGIWHVMEVIVISSLMLAGIICTVYISSAASMRIN